MTLSLRDVIVVPPLVREGRRKSHIRRGSILPLLVLLLAALPLLPFRERERKRHKSKKKSKKHSKSRSSKRDKREKKKHKRKRSPSPSPSSSSSVSSDSSSSPQRSPARKKSRINSWSPSLADDNPHSASRAASPASHWEHLSLFADNDDKFNLHSEDNQDLAPDTEMQNVSEIQSEASTDDMKF